MIAAAASITESFSWLVMSADLIMGSEVGTPAARAFDIIVMGIVEPHRKPFSPDFCPTWCSTRLWIAIFPFGIVQICLGASGAYLVICPSTAPRHCSGLKFSTGKLVHFLHRSDKVGQERNAGTFMGSWSGCTAATHPLPRQLGHPSYRRHFLGRSADVIHSCLPASSRSNAAAGRA
jgi:hypothetical protein